MGLSADHAARAASAGHAASAEESARALKRGSLVAFPTETVYGLGADATNADAIARLYAAKGRPPNHPVIVHIPNAAAMPAWASLAILDFAWATALITLSHWGLIDLNPAPVMMGNPPLVVISFFALPFGIFVSVYLIARMRREIKSRVSSLNFWTSSPKPLCMASKPARLKGLGSTQSLRPTSTPRRCDTKFATLGVSTSERPRPSAYAQKNQLQ